MDLIGGTARPGDRSRTQSVTPTGSACGTGVTAGPFLPIHAWSGHARSLAALPEEQHRWPWRARACFHAIPTARRMRQFAGPPFPSLHDHGSVGTVSQLRMCALVHRLLHGLVQAVISSLATAPRGGVTDAASAPPGLRSQTDHPVAGGGTNCTGSTGAGSAGACRDSTTARGARTRPARDRTRAARDRRTRGAGDRTQPGGIEPVRWRVGSLRRVEPHRRIEIAATDRQLGRRGCRRAFFRG